MRSTRSHPAPAATAQVIVTRPQPQADEWVARLRSLGLAAGALPLLGIDDPTDAAAVQAAWRTLAGVGELPAMVMFVSPSAVDRFFAQRPAGLAWPAGVLACGPGPGTRSALRLAGVPEAALRSPAEDAGRFDSEALWQLIGQQIAWPGRQALVVRGDGGRDWLAETLRSHGATVVFVEAYRRTAPVLDAAGQALLQAALARPADCCWLFSSSQAVGHLRLLAPQADWSRSSALATHARIADAARRLGMVDVACVLPSPEAVAAALRGGAAA